MRAGLTDKLLRSLKPAPSGKRITVWDCVVLGLGIRVTDRGYKSFFVMRRQHGVGRSQPVRFILGPYPLLPLAEARRRARAVLLELRDGIDPRERRAALRRAEAAKRSNTFLIVAEDFIDRHISKKRTARSIELRIRRELITRWGDRPISDISRTDVVHMVEEIVDDHRPEAARMSLTYCKRLFGWAIARGVYGIAQAPTDRVNAVDLIGPKQPRQRILSDTELRLLWRATEPIDHTYPEGPYVRLLLMLGQRRNELARTTWAEFDLERALWVIPAERMKANEGHTVPLPKSAVAILRKLPRFAGSDLVFSASVGRKPLNDFGAVKLRLDRRIAELNEGKPIAAWTLHDLRRTARTALSTLGVAPHIAELCIGHRQQGLARTYDLHRFEDEKRDALERWAIRLLAIVEPPPDNVVTLAEARDVKQAAVVR